VDYPINYPMDNFGDYTQPQIHTTATRGWNQLGLAQCNNDANPAIMYMAKSRGASPGTYAVVHTGDGLASIVATADVGGIFSWNGSLDFGCADGTVVGGHVDTD